MATTRKDYVGQPDPLRIRSFHLGFNRVRQRGKEATLLVVINGSPDLVEFTLPACTGGSEWSLLIDTNIADEESGKFNTGDAYSVTARSVLMFVLESEK